MKVLIEKLDNQAKGITHISDKIVFIPNCLPNEIVDIEIVKEKKKYAEGLVKSYIKKSPKRIEPLCPYFELCGGCDLMHVSYIEQLEYKQNKIREVISKFTNLDIEIKTIIGSNNINYRNKITLHNKKKIGYFSKKTNDIINIDNCLIADTSINYILKKLNELKLDNIYEIVIRNSKSSKENMIILKLSDLIDNDYYINNLKDYVNTIVTYKNNKYEIIYGNGYVFERLGNYKFKISPESFFQVNTLQAEKLYEKVLEYIEPTGNESVLDLYCGTGTIGIYISKYVRKVYGIEINEKAIEDAKANKKINNINNIDFECLDASLVNKIKDNFDVIIVDPPRSGLDKKTVDYLLNSNSKKIVYVSCDPITLARDLNLLKSTYDIKEITPVDMFPNTYHVECVCVLKLK